MPSLEDAALSYGNLSIMLRGANRLDESADAIRKAADIFEQLASERPDNTNQQWWLGISKSNLGDTLAQSGQHEAASASYDDALSILEKLVSTHPVRSDYRDALLGAYGNFANLLLRRDAVVCDPAKAAAILEKVATAKPNDHAAWRRLADARYQAGDWNGTIAAVERSLELGAAEGSDWFWLAMAHKQLGHAEEARKYYKQGIDWMEKNKREDEQAERLRTRTAQLLGDFNEPP
jgi:tetratricopeptide (TPR) repeat protein